MKVLVVDEPKYARDSLAWYLSLQPGIEVVGAAGDGESAIRLSAGQRPDVVILHVTQPVEESVAIVRRLTEAPVAPVVIALVAHPDENVRRKAVEAGAARCVEMCAGVEALMESVRDSVEERGCGVLPNRTVTAQGTLDHGGRTPAVQRRATHGRGSGDCPSE